MPGEDGKERKEERIRRGSQVSPKPTQTRKEFWKRAPRAGGHQINGRGGELWKFGVELHKVGLLAGRGLSSTQRKLSKQLPEASRTVLQAPLWPPAGWGAPALAVRPGGARTSRPPFPGLAGHAAAWPRGPEPRRAVALRSAARRVGPSVSGQGSRASPQHKARPRLPPPRGLEGAGKQTAVPPAPRVSAQKGVLSAGGERLPDVQDFYDAGVTAASRTAVVAERRRGAGGRAAIQPPFLKTRPEVGDFSGRRAVPSLPTVLEVGVGTRGKRTQ